MFCPHFLCKSKTSIILGQGLALLEEANLVLLEPQDLVLPEEQGLALAERQGFGFRKSGPTWGHEGYLLAYKFENLNFDISSAQTDNYGRIPDNVS